MKTIILLIALVLSNLGFSCEILPNGKCIPCNTAAAEIMFEQSAKQSLKYLGYDKVEIENIKTNIEYNVKLAESRMNEAEVKYIESIKKYNTARHNAASKSFIKSLIKQKVNAYIAKQKANADIAKQKSNADIVIQKAYYEACAKQEAYFEITFAKQKAHSEMRIAEFEYEKARSECGRIYAIAKGESTSLPVGKSPSEIFKLIK